MTNLLCSEYSKCIAIRILVIGGKHTVCTRIWPIYRVEKPESRLIPFKAIRQLNTLGKSGIIGAGAGESIFFPLTSFIHFSIILVGKIKFFKNISLHRK